MAETFDIAKVEEDPFADVNNMTAFYDEIQKTYDILHYTAYFTDTIKLIICILSIVADFCIITIILKNPKLKTITNIYILHYSIWRIVFMSFFPMFYGFLDLVDLADSIPMIVFWIFVEMNDLSIAVIFLFGLFLALDWFLNIHSPNFVKSSALFNKYAIYLIYVVAALVFTLVHFVGMVILDGLYIVVALSLSVFNFLDYRNPKNENNLKNYGLVPSNIIIFFWLPIFAFEHFLTWSYGHVTLYSILIFTIFLAEWFSLSMSLVLFITLIKMDRNIEIAMHNIFNRRNRRSRDDVEILEEAEIEDVPNSVATESNSVYV
ncbi:uncharacterized protein LOC126892789 [Diabrotica virgifera virgifera]|uniref:Uncharacterized protein n=1 Tax=Diabrotica virgifera virgifera TaxID=50390 RepID=A0ABM5L7R3_DIAVI|nr:uncharacterized protein LOC126892789 [Diabrotica virgifera virgifera]